MDAFLNVLTEQFDNREIAIAFWSLVFLGFMLRYRSVRKSLFQLFKVALHRKILAVLLLLGAYVSLLILGLERMGAWNATSHLKDTLIWVVAVAFVMVMNFTDVTKEKNYFRKTVVGTLKLTIVLGFVMGLFPFGLPVELVLVPLLALVGFLLVYAELKEEYLPARKIFRLLLALMGLVFIVHFVRNLLTDVNGVVNFERFVELALPSVLTILLLPFIYFLSLFSAYEHVFLRLGIQNSDAELIRYAKRRIVWHFGLNLSRLVNWSRQSTLVSVNNKDEVLELLGTASPRMS